MKNEVVIYTSKNGDVSLYTDAENSTLLANLKEIANLFGVQKAAISKHLKNIFKENELEEKATVSILETVQKEGKRTIIRQIKYYNLDAILSVGYRVNSKNATEFRIWATKTLKQHITKGYTINQKVLENNKQQFLDTLKDLRILSQNNNLIQPEDILSLIESFSNTFFTLEKFDKNNFPKKGEISEIKASANDLSTDLQLLKDQLIKKREATELFAQEKKQGNLKGIFGNVFQSVFGVDAYPSVEEKAAHLLYFIVKNHPFNDGNKRSGAFSFVWLLQKANYDFTQKITPETLTTLTLLIAISAPDEKDKMIGLVLLLLK